MMHAAPTIPMPEPLPPQRDPEPKGRRVARTLRRYTIIERIAAGGMAVVFLGRAKDDVGAIEPVAIKILHPHLADNPDVVSMFIDEARVTSKLTHPNVVAVRDVDFVNDELVIVMQYVAGTSLGRLHRYLREKGETLGVPASLRIVHDLLLGLHAAHELRDERGTPLEVVHRDVSPQNILIGADGTSQVTDFGVASAVGRLATTAPDGTLKGKLRYVSPEQFRRDAITRRADVFAAGIVLWECLTGKPLFGGDTEADTIGKILRDPIVPPSAHNPQIPLELDEICLRALERDPSLRFESAHEFAEALASVPQTPLGSRAAVSAIVMGAAGSEIEDRERALRSAPDKPLSMARELETLIREDGESAPPSPIDQGNPRAKRSWVSTGLVAVISLLVGVGLTVSITQRAGVDAPSATPDRASATISSAARPIEPGGDPPTGVDTSASPENPSPPAASEFVELDDGDPTTLGSAPSSAKARAHPAHKPRPKLPRPKQPRAASPAASGDRPFMPSGL